MGAAHRDSAPAERPGAGRLAVLRGRRARRPRLGVPRAPRPGPGQRVHPARRGLRGDGAGLRRPRLGPRALGPGDRQNRQQQLPGHHDRPRHPVRCVRRGLARPVPAAAARRDRRAERARVPIREQRPVPGRRGHGAGGLRRTPAGDDRDAGGTRRPAGQAQVSVRRRGDRGRRAAVADAGTLRHRLQPAGRRHRAAAHRLRQPVGLRPRPVPAARLPGHHRLRLVWRPGPRPEADVPATTRRGGSRSSRAWPTGTPRPAATTSAEAAAARSARAPAAVSRTAWSPAPPRRARRGRCRRPSRVPPGRPRCCPG